MLACPRCGDRLELIALITWTANIQGWTITRGLFEYSSKLETIEIISPRQDANGAFAGLTIETIFYDPEAFVEQHAETRQPEPSPHVHRMSEQHRERQREAHPDTAE